MVPLSRLTRILRTQESLLPRQYVEGKTVMRDTIMTRLRCTATRAERLVDELESTGRIQFHRDRRGARSTGWEIFEPAAVQL